MTQMKFELQHIRAIIGLGNPGAKHYKTRHSIGFQIVDALVKKYHGTWQSTDLMEYSTIRIDESSISHELIVIKPQTYMNSSGKVLPWLQKKGIKPEQILVIHDELEKPFDHVSISFGGSHKGHNGLKSIMEMIGKDFWRLKFGIGRPADKAQVPDYVLSAFSPLEESKIDQLITQSLHLLGI